MAHNAGGSLQQGVPADKLAQVWEFRTSDLFPEAEKVALEYAIASASQPNDVTDELFDRLRQHWDDGQIVEITALVSFFGFMNRWNDSLATPLEDEPAAVAEEHITDHGWQLGKHAPGR
ncbi:MAG: carboxymuconolactone decarboxylase family protein [Pseudomonadota bacterium]|jgi:alkylhydroperoxidase family enzyme